MEHQASSTTAASHTEWLRAHRNEIVHRRNGARALERRWSWARLICFGGAVAVWLLPESGTAGATSAALLVIFAFAVRRHRIACERRELADREVQIVEESLQRCGGRVVLVRSRERPPDPAATEVRLDPACDDGPRWPLTEQERDDLDLYAGPVGLFGLLNRTSTVLGARRLRDISEKPLLSVNHIRRRQKSIRWLEEHPTARLRIMAATALLRGCDPLLEQLIGAVRSAEALPWPRRAVLARLWSLISVGITAFVMVQWVSGDTTYLHALLGLALLNGCVYAAMRPTLQQRIAPWKTLGTVLQGFSHVADHGAACLPNNTPLTTLRERLAPLASGGVPRSLGRRVAWADTGGMLHALCNLLFFYDLHVAAAILNRAVPHRDGLLTGLAAMAEADALTSLACFAYESRDAGPVCYPDLVERPTLGISRGRHPLIAPERSVPNDVRLNTAERMWIVTGSNMAGKSTLLRMCGTNCLLAQLGATALAEDMALSPMRLITDLQARDNLAADESYFLAEVRHVRRMVIPATDRETILGLMDEPFRGTNSIEQVAAAVAVVEHLLRSGHLFLVATHEQQLAAFAEQHEEVDNRHFQENLTDGGTMVYDYRLCAGPATTRNALRVLEREGYPPELLARAHDWLRTRGGNGPTSG